MHLYRDSLWISHPYDSHMKHVLTIKLRPLFFKLTDTMLAFTDVSFEPVDNALEFLNQTAFVVFASFHHLLADKDLHY